MLAAGAVGYGAVIVLQNAGIERTSVTHASLIVGAVPVLVAVIAAAVRPRHGRRRPRGPARWWRSRASASWRAAAVTGTSLAGDLLVLASVTGSAALHRHAAAAAARAATPAP